MNEYDLGPLFTPGQYDALTVDKPERQRKPRPEADIVAQLHILFSEEGDRTLYQTARKLYNSLGVEYSRRGLDALARIPGWASTIIKYKVKSMTQVTRIEQAAASTDGLARPPVDIRVEMGRRQAALLDADQGLVTFLQELHTSHPAMRRHIKTAAESVLRAAFQKDVERAPSLVGEAIAIARKDAARIDNIKKNYRIPKETATWLQQIIVRL